MSALAINFITNAQLICLTVSNIRFTPSDIACAVIFCYAKFYSPLANGIACGGYIRRWRVADLFDITCERIT